MDASGESVKVWDDKEACGHRRKCLPLEMLTLIPISSFQGFLFGGTIQIPPNTA